MKPTTAISLAILAVTGVLLFAVLKKFGDLKLGATEDDPTGNIISRGFDELITAGQADEGFSLGGFIFDLFNPEFDPNKDTQGTADERAEIRREQIGEGLSRLFPE